jgi:solute:Na+ symporter, SSS family
VLGAFIIGRSYITEQNIVQRYLVARSDREARRGVLAGSLACLPIWIAFLFIGAGLWAFYQMHPRSLPAEIIARPDNILPYFVATQLPPGVVGLILAAIIAAAQSTISADLNSVSTVVTTDYFTRFLPRSTDKQRLVFARAVVAAGGLVSTLAALLLTSGRARAANELSVMIMGIFAAGMPGLFSLGFLVTRLFR